jgi:hypothetical protein
MLLAVLVVGASFDTTTALLLSQTSTAVASTPLAVLVVGACHHYLATFITDLNRAGPLCCWLCWWLKHVPNEPLLTLLSLAPYAAGCAGGGSSRLLQKGLLGGEVRVTRPSLGTHLSPVMAPAGSALARCWEPSWGGGGGGGEGWGGGGGRVGGGQQAGQFVVRHVRYSSSAGLESEV